MENLLNQPQPFINIARHFQLISEMSENDLKTLGHSIGFAPTLDNPKAANILQLLQILLPLLVMVYLTIVCLPILQIIKQLQEHKIQKLVTLRTRLKSVVMLI
jgi:hypothetical protein